MLIELFPIDPLDAEAVYRLKIAPTGRETFGTEIASHTGTGAGNGPEHPPELREATATWLNSDSRIAVDVKIDHRGIDEDHLTVVQARDAEADRVVHSCRAPLSGFLEASLDWVDGRRPVEVCPPVRGIDGAGVATEWQEFVCTPVGCCAVGSGASLGALVLAGLAATRRRASSCSGRAAPR